MGELLAANRFEDPKIGHVDGIKTQVLNAVKVDGATDAWLAYLPELMGDFVEDLQVVFMCVLVRKPRGVDNGEVLPPIHGLVRPAGCACCVRWDNISEKDARK